MRDALIIDVDGSLHNPRQSLVEGVLFGSGRPVILVPKGIDVFSDERILVAWDATRSSGRAVHDALPLLARSGEVTVVSILDDKTLSDQDPGKLCNYLALWDVPARAVVVKRDNRSVGMALLDYAEHSNSNLLVMGGFAHGFERALILGSATRDIFQAKLKIPVLLSN